jgi:hypothetical protein
MIEQYVMMNLHIYGIAIIFTILLFTGTTIILKKLREALHDLPAIPRDKLKLIVVFGFLLETVIFFVTIIGATMVRINLLSDGADDGIIYLISVVTIGHFGTLVAYLMLFYLICNSEREIKKERLQQHEDDKKLGGISQ